MLKLPEVLGVNLGIKRYVQTIQSGSHFSFRSLNTMFIIVCEGSWYLGAFRWSDLQEIAKYSGGMRFSVESDGSENVKIISNHETALTITAIVLGEV